MVEKSIIARSGVRSVKNDNHSLGSIVSACTTILEERHMELLTYLLLHAIGTVIIADVILG